MADTAHTYRNGGAAVVETLASYGVDTVFGIPGTHNLELYRHFTSHGIRHITPRHEQGAGYAADGFARVTGRPAVVITTTGPGLTNAMTAAATSYADSVPVLYVSPGVPRGAVGRDVGLLHETKNSSAAMDNLVRWSRRVDSPGEAAQAVHDAFASFDAGRPRPVHIEVPVDVLEEAWPGDGGAGRTARGAGLTARGAGTPTPLPADADLGAAADLLASSSRVAILAGGGSVDAGDPLRRLAEALDAPVVTTCNGKGVLPETHPLSVGSQIRLRVVQRFLADSDVVLVVGSELGDSDLWGGRFEARRVVRVDVDDDQLHKNAAADVALRGDATAVLESLCTELTGRTGGERGDGARRTADVREALLDEAVADAGADAELCRAIGAVLPDNAIVTGDSSQVCYYGAVHFVPLQRPRRFLYMPGYATLGYALPAAIGGALADADAPVTVFVGDGAFMFSVQELMTAVEQRLPMAVVLTDNGGYREIRDGMDAAGIERTGVELRRPDFVTMARAFGARAVHASDTETVTAAVTDAWQADVPTVIVVDRH